MNKLSVNLLLKSVIGALAAAVVALLIAGAWDSWTRLKSAERIANVAGASADIFASLHNLRLDRTMTPRALQAEPVLATLAPEIAKPRAAMMPALKAALASVETIDFPGRQAALSNLDAAIKKLASLHQDSEAALRQPKSARNAALAKEFIDATTGMIDMLDKLSTELTKLIMLQDPYVDQLMELKQLAWNVRYNAGDLSVMVSNPMNGVPLLPEPLVKYTALLSKVESVWGVIGDIAAMLPLPAKFTEAVAISNREFFSKDYADERLKVYKAVIAGQPPGYTVATWTPIAVPKLTTVLAVAEAALDAAKDHAAGKRATAMSSLVTQLALLVFAVLFAAGMMMLVSRRVTRPLSMIQGAMHKLAGGDMSAEVSFGERRDEIGALGNATLAFKSSMVEANRLRVEQQESEGKAAAQRKQEMRKLADEFQAAVGSIVGAVSGASGELETAARTLTKTADTTQQLAGMVTSASEEASANVQSVASAAEEMSGSVNEIGRQVQESSRIAAEAVSQAQKTDARITELSSAASRIGDVVKMITAIAEQTNLLALNATIEAARAGEAGRGFAVVASEVKALASQTAKATDEIGTQIAAMQTATQDSVGAIKEIGGTIGRIAEIAATIAAAVEEQGAATQEISRNVHQAAQGTAQVATNITDVNRGANETGAASAQVLGSAQALSRESGHLKAEVEKFVASVRAA
jgi:methyl-accepting chemotaxis protein